MSQDLFLLLILVQLETYSCGALTRKNEKKKVRFALSLCFSSFRN
ncbi:unnamed protein product [Spirodela intermedia]|uniref:Uncharacterized protein n=1 Tax=Spirodela intermedia TaxID=51605 RepID=A0A7I8J9R9_SPIIN|nr:unnamed protein product [Spirodela intermedia]CAA6666897.1 unnamed protein product [Spirodela intermedia]